MTPSEGFRQILEEWWVTPRFPELEYRDASFLRLASIRNGPGIADWVARPARYRIASTAAEQAADYAVLVRSRIEARLSR